MLLCKHAFASSSFYDDCKPANENYVHKRGLLPLPYGHLCQIIFLSLSTLHRFMSRHSAIDPAGKCRREACRREMEMKLNSRTAFSLKGLPLLSFSSC